MKRHCEHNIECTAFCSDSLLKFEFKIPTDATLLFLIFDTKFLFGTEHAQKVLLVAGHAQKCIGAVLSQSVPGWSLSVCKLMSE